MAVIAISQEEKQALIAALSSPNKPTQLQASAALIAIGPPAIDHLLATLSHPSEQMRVQVVRILGQIGDPRVAAALVNELEDEAVAVRWTAAESLVALGCDGLRALLQALIRRSASVWLRLGAHHVLRDLAARSNLDDVVKPVLTALESVEPIIVVPPAAKSALNRLQTNLVQRQTSFDG